jgi:hypothetical protein
MSRSDVRESGLLDAAVDPVHVVLDHEMTIAAAISGRKRIAVCPQSVRVVPRLALPRGAGAIAAALETGDLCPPADVTALRPWSRRTDV